VPDRIVFEHPGRKEAASLNIKSDDGTKGLVVVRGGTRSGGAVPGFSLWKVTRETNGKKTE